VFTQLGTAKDWKEITTGNINSTVYGLKTDGRLYGWGWNTYRNIGDAIPAGVVYSPVEVTGGPYISASQGNNHAHVIKSDGSLWAIGRQAWSALGIPAIGEGTTISAFQRVGSGNDWKKVRGGIGYNIALKTDGSIWHWGNYQIGGGTSPTRIDMTTLNKDIVLGANTAVVIKSDGTIWGIGLNDYEQLLTGNTTAKSSFVQLSNSNNWKSVEISQYNIVALSEIEGY
jgi:alpha-tubulin suppressor-like RCC1 family protein